MISVWKPQTKKKLDAHLEASDKKRILNMGRVKWIFRITVGRIVIKQRIFVVLLLLTKLSQKI